MNAACPQISPPRRPAWLAAVSLGLGFGLGLFSPLAAETGAPKIPVDPEPIPVTDEAEAIEDIAFGATVVTLRAQVIDQQLAKEAALAVVHQVSAQVAHRALAALEHPAAPDGEARSIELLASSTVSAATAGNLRATQRVLSGYRGLTALELVDAVLTGVNAGASVAAEEIGVNPWRVTTAAAAAPPVAAWFARVNRS